MKLGVNPWTVYGWELPGPIEYDLIKSLAAMGCQGIELVLDEGHNTEERLVSRLPSLSAQLEEFGMEVPGVASALFWQYNLASQNQAMRRRGLEVLQAGCRVAQAYGAGVFLIVAGLQEPGVEYQRTYATAVSSVRQAGDYAANLGITIGVENVPSNFLCSPGEYARFLADVDHPAVQAYLDFGNGVSLGPSFPENWITAVRGRIALVHAKDFDKGFTGFVCCGQGDLDWNCVFTALADVGYQGYLIVETPPKGGRGTPTYAAGLQAAQISLSWLAQHNK